MFPMSFFYVRDIENNIDRGTYNELLRIANLLFDMIAFISYAFCNFMQAHTAILFKKWTSSLLTVYTATKQC